MGNNHTKKIKHGPVQFNINLLESLNIFIFQLDSLFYRKAQVHFMVKGNAFSRVLRPGRTSSTGAFA